MDIGQFCAQSAADDHATQPIDAANCLLTAGKKLTVTVSPLALATLHECVAVDH